MLAYYPAVQVKPANCASRVVMRDNHTMLKEFYRGVRIYLVAGCCAVYKAQVGNKTFEHSSLQYVKDCIYEATFKDESACN